MQTLYVALKDQVTLVGLKHVRICDVAELDGEAALVKRANDLILIDIERRDPHSFRIGFLDVTRLLRRFCQGVEANSVGAQETLVHFRPDRPPRRPVQGALKVLFVSLILFFGAAIALMTFQTDAAVPDVFINIHRIFTGEETERPVALILSYTAGIALGIILFFNHWAGIKIKEDPTPVEVEYVTYKKEIQTCMLDMLKKQDDFGQGDS